MLAALFGCSAQVMDFWEPQPGSPEFGSLTSALAEAALVVVNAEGTLHHRHTLLHPSLELAARHGADVPLWIINSSFQYNLSAPVHGTLGFFRDAAYAALRDGMSYAAVRSALPWARHLTLSADLTVLLPHRFTSDVEKQLAARVPARKSRDVSQGTPLRIVLSASALHMAAYASFWRELIPLVLAYHPNSTFILALDCNRKLSSEPWARFPGKYPGANFEGLCEYETLAEVLWTLRCADVFIGGRFHAATCEPGRVAAPSVTCPLRLPVILSVGRHLSPAEPATTIPFADALLAGLPAVLLPSNTWKVEAWAALVSSPGVDYVPAGPAAGAEQVWQRAQGVMAQREQLGHRGLAGLRQLALHNFPLSEPVQVASRVTAEELRMQRSWLAQTANKRRRSTFCERFGGRIKDGKSPTRRSLS
jgi:hypothetical protein